MNVAISNYARVSIIAILIGLTGILASCTDGDSDADVTEPQAEATEPVDPVVRGEQSFVTYCASCHGRDGAGGGPVSNVMTTQPADLTQLRSQYDGAFPTDSVYAYIDGRADVLAHGTREMPVWGNVWGEEAGGVQVPREEVDLRIRELVEYIRTLQENPADAS